MTSVPTVTISKEYFETLLRRANFDVTTNNFVTPLGLSTITIPKSEHDNLLQTLKEYKALREALFRGGISRETLEVLISNSNDNTSTTPAVDRQNSLSGVALGQNLTSAEDNSQFLDRTNSNQAIKDNTNERHGNTGPSYHGRHRTHSLDSSCLSDPEAVDRDDFFVPGNGQAFADHATERKPPFPKQCKRTILMVNVSERVTHKDIVNVLRGGTVLDIFIRPHERTASISWVEERAAMDFMEFVRRNDLYICDKRVEVRWNDRQFILPGHVANKIANGATRNLILRACHPNITEARIRDDLEHIHNLVVIDVAFRAGNVLVSTNSVHNSLYARTCMMSRSAYKGLKIDWYPDECAAALPKLPPRRASTEKKPAPKRKPTTGLNRFQLLNIDGEATESGESESEAVAGERGGRRVLTPESSGINWADTRVAI